MIIPSAVQWLTPCQEEIKDTSLEENKGSWIGFEAEEETNQ